MLTVVLRCSHPLMEVGDIFGLVILYPPARFLYSYDEERIQ